MEDIKNKNLESAFEQKQNLGLEKLNSKLEELWKLESFLFSESKVTFWWVVDWKMDLSKPDSDIDEKLKDEFEKNNLDLEDHTKLEELSKKLEIVSELLDLTKIREGNKKIEDNITNTAMDFIDWNLKIDDIDNEILESINFWKDVTFYKPESIEIIEQKSLNISDENYEYLCSNILLLDIKNIKYVNLERLNFYKILSVSDLLNIKDVNFIIENYNKFGNIFYNLNNEKLILDILDLYWTKYKDDFGIEKFNFIHNSFCSNNDQIINKYLSVWGDISTLQQVSINNYSYIFNNWLFNEFLTTNIDSKKCSELNIWILNNESPEDIFKLIKFVVDEGIFISINFSRDTYAKYDDLLSLINNARLDEIKNNKKFWLWYYFENYLINLDTYYDIFPIKNKSDIISHDNSLEGVPSLWKALLDSAKWYDFNYSEWDFNQSFKKGDFEAKKDFIKDVINAKTINKDSLKFLCNRFPDVIKILYNLNKLDNSFIAYYIEKSEINILENIDNYPKAFFVDNPDFLQTLEKSKWNDFNYKVDKYILDCKLLTWDKDLLNYWLVNLIKIYNENNDYKNDLSSKDSLINFINWYIEQNVEDFSLKNILTYYSNPNFLSIRNNLANITDEIEDKEVKKAVSTLADKIPLDWAENIMKTVKNYYENSGSTKDLLTFYADMWLDKSQNSANAILDWWALAWKVLSEVLTQKENIKKLEKKLWNIQWVTFKYNEESWEYIMDISSWWVNIWENATAKITSDWKVNIVNSLGYSFEFDKNLWESAWSMLDVVETAEFVDKIWLGYFGEDFKDIVDTIWLVSSHIPWLTSINISETLWNVDFLNKKELNRICNIFSDTWFFSSKDIWFMWINQVESMTKAEFTQKQNNSLSSFYTNWVFMKENFKDLLVDTYS